MQFLPLSLSSTLFKLLQAPWALTSHVSFAGDPFMLCLHALHLPRHTPIERAGAGRVPPHPALYSKATCCLVPINHSLDHSCTLGGKNPALFTVSSLGREVIIAFYSLTRSAPPCALWASVLPDSSAISSSEEYAESRPRNTHNLGPRP